MRCQSRFASTRAGINMDATARFAELVLETARLTADRGGLRCAKLVCAGLSIGPGSAWAAGWDPGGVAVANLDGKGAPEIVVLDREKNRGVRLATEYPRQRVHATLAGTVLQVHLFTDNAFLEGIRPGARDPVRAGAGPGGAAAAGSRSECASGDQHGREMSTLP